jgi:hypothetical protein
VKKQIGVPSSGKPICFQVAHGRGL